MTAARRCSEETVGWILCTTASAALSKRRQASGEMDEGSGRAGAGSGWGWGTGEYSSMSTMGPREGLFPGGVEQPTARGTRLPATPGNGDERAKELALGAGGVSLAVADSRERSARAGSRSGRRRRRVGIGKRRIREHGSEGF